MPASVPDEQPTTLGELAVERVWDGWFAEAESSIILDDQTASRAYKLWNFAADLNAQSIDDVGRGTVVQKLWNAVDHRIRALHTIYHLNVVRSLLGLPRSTTSLDVLRHLGVIRPLILKNLKSVRNRVEHQDRDAPNELECNNLVDSVWYFLRSTDYLVLEKLQTYTLRSGMTVQGYAEREEFISISVSDDWNMRLYGWFREENVATDFGDIEAGIVLRLDRQPNHFESSDVFLSGIVSSTSADFAHLIRGYFAVGVPSGARGNHDG